VNVVFTAPALLLGLLVAALPLIVHLISRRRARLVRFAAMEFVLVSQKRTARNLRLRQLLLLLLRTLLLLAPALAIAGPVLRKDTAAATTTTAPRAVVVVVDTSASMHARARGGRVIERARELARDRVLALNDDVKVALIACGASADARVAPPTFERARITGALDALDATMAKGTLAPCVARAAALAREVEGEGERRVVVVSDLARHAFAGEPPATDGDQVVVEWVDAADDDAPSNVGITALDVTRAAGGAPTQAMRIGFTLAQRGGVAREIPVDLIVDGARVARLAVPLPADGQEERAFTHAFEATGDDASNHAVELRTEGDALSPDDTVHVPVDVPRTVQVLVVDGAPQPIPFDDEVYYLESALTRGDHAGGHLAVDVVGVDALTPARLAGARVVVLANVGALDRAVAAALVEHVRAGGGLFVTSGDQVDVDWMNDALGPVLPGRLRGVKGQATLDDASVAETLGLARFAPNHPALAPLGRDARALAGLSRVETHTFMLLEPEGDAPREVLVSFTNDAPALVERRVDAGRVVLLTTTIDRDWTDLPIRPGFLPLMQLVVMYLASALDDSGPRVVTVGDTRAIALPRDVDLAVVRGPDDAPRAAPVVEDGAARRALVSSIDLPGLYRVSFARTGGEPTPAPRERFTALFPSSEGDLTQADDALLDDATPRGARRERQGASDDDEPLWPFLLALAVLLFTAEGALVRRASPAR